MINEWMLIGNAAFLNILLCLDPFYVEYRGFKLNIIIWNWKPFLICVFLMFKIISCALHCCAIKLLRRSVQYSIFRNIFLSRSHSDRNMYVEPSLAIQKVWLEDKCIKEMCKCLLRETVQSFCVYLITDMCSMH